MSQKFYKLSHNLDRFQPDGVGEFGDGYLENKFKHWDEIDLVFSDAIKIDLTGQEVVIIREQRPDNLWYTIKVQMPADLLFVGFDDLFVYTDYPYILETRLWPIMSRKMLVVLLSLGNFSHQLIPVTFKCVSDFLSPYEKIQETSSIFNYNFLIIQLLEHLDAFDMDRSDYTKTPYESNPKAERINIHKMVLKEPVNGFPPIFRVKEDETSLYVSAEAKEALEKAGIQGLDFSSYNIESS
jgi:hypothetical protein